MTNVLDHGYVNVIDTWGSEEQIVEAARMSTNKAFQGWGPRCSSCKRALGPGTNWTTCPNAACEGADPEPGDERLLRYLWRHHHATPFEMAGATFEVQAPIFVFREWHRHRVPFGYNEMSGRYTPLPDVNYVPSIDRLMRRGPDFESASKQAGVVVDAAELTEESAIGFQEDLRVQYHQAESLYRWALKAGVPKELARVHLPVGRYSRMRATGNLRGWLAFLTLRMAPNAQWEIRQYANAIHHHLAEHFPRVLALFDEDAKEGRGEL